MTIVIIFSAAAALAAALYVLWKFLWGPPPPLPSVLAYHKVTSFEMGGTWISPRRFERQLDFLMHSGYRFISETDFLDTLEGRRELNRKEILLTFDDGYSMLLDNALPALEERGIPVLIFLVTSYAGRDNSWELSLPGRRATHLGWDDVSQLASRQGISFGSHSRSHRDLTRLPRQKVEDELLISKQVIEHHTGLEVQSISYPFGRVNAQVAAVAEEAGYRAGFTLYPPGRSTPPGKMILRREGVWVIDNGLSLLAKLSGGPFFWIEDLKGRAINSFAGITPAIRKNSPFDI